MFDTTSKLLPLRTRGSASGASGSDGASNRPSKKQRKSTSLPNETVEYLKAWMMSPEHIAHPYPTELEKAKIMEDTGIEQKQLTNWFVNNRKRFWKPRVEARLREQQLGNSNSPPIMKRDGSLLSLVDIAASPVSSNNSSPVRSTPKRKAARKAATVTAAAQVISENSSVASSSESMDSSDEEVLTGQPTEEMYTKTEVVSVHILRPTSEALPELSDVTIKCNIPSERILRSFEDCALTYRYPSIQRLHSRRDAEIVRMKRHYLQVYLAETSVKAIATDAERTLAAPVTPPITKKRFFEQDLLTTLSLPRKYPRVGVAGWKEACQTAETADELPSLEEAARLFGYAP